MRRANTITEREALERTRAVYAREHAWHADLARLYADRIAACNELLDALDRQPMHLCIQFTGEAA